MQQPQGVQEQDWRFSKETKTPHFDMEVGIPMPWEFPIAWQHSLSFWQLGKLTALGPQFTNPQ